MAQEKFDKRFGMVAIEKQFITSEQLLNAIKIQINEDIAGDKHRLIGEVLMDEGYIIQIQIDEVLTVLGLL